MSDFSKQYENKKWYQKRKEILEREEYICQHCKRQKNELNVHHTYYDRNKKIWEYDNDSLLCLCKRCHSNLHDFLDEVNRLVAFCYPDKYERIIQEIINVKEG